MTRAGPIFLVTGLAALAACTPPGGSGRGRFGPAPLSVEPVYVNPPNVPQLNGVSAAVKVGLVLYISAQVPMDTAGRLVAPGDLAGQVSQAMDNLFTVVRAARGVPPDLVKLTIYHLPAGADQIDILRDAMVARFPPGRAPALTLVSVPSFPVPDLLLTVDGVAMLRGEFPDRTRDRP